MKIFFQKLYFIFFSNDFQCFYWKKKKKAWHAQICLIIAPPPGRKNSLFSRGGGGAIIRHTKNFLAKIPIYFFYKFCPKILFVFFLIYFFTAEVSHFLGTKIQKHLFSKKNIFQNCLHKNIVLNFVSPKRD